ncbi:hypothetical protein HYS84_03140 [Candidatus Saccharibacteria bacterium]|nr:hypothetical protein [Candidatus Saccharibacteria bacterium]
MKRSAKGFTMVEVLLALIFITLVSFVGWYVWKSTKETKTSLSNSGGSDNISTAPAKEKKYLEVKEDGVKFELTDKIEDAYYYYNQDAGAYISLKRYDNVQGFEGCTAKGGTDSEGSGLAHLSSAKVGDDNFGSQFTEAELADRVESRGKKIGETYYWLESNSQAPCWDFDNIPEDDKRVQEMIKFRSELVGQGKTITISK